MPARSARKPQHLTVKLPNKGNGRRKKKTIIFPPSHYTVSRPKILVAMNRNNSDATITLILDGRTAATLLRSVRRSRLQIEGGEDWNAEKKRLTKVEAALTAEGVTSP